MVTLRCNSKFFSIRRWILKFFFKLGNSPFRHQPYPCRFVPFVAVIENSKMVVSQTIIRDCNIMFISIRVSTHLSAKSRTYVYRQSSVIVHKQVGNKSLVLQLRIDKNHKSIWSPTTDGKLKTCFATFCSVKLVWEESLKNLRKTFM